MNNVSALIPAPFGLLEVSGPERSEFLNRLLSNDMQLAPGQGTGAYFLSVQGRPLARFWAFEDGQSTWLVSPDSTLAEGYRQLDAMHFGERLRIFDRSSEWRPEMWAGSGRRQALQEKLGSPVAAGPWSFQKGQDWMLCGFPWLATGSHLLWLPADSPPTASVPALSREEWEGQRLRAGRAWPSDWSEKTMLLEIAEDSDYLDGKGCYPGQEVVARTLHRGHVNRRLLPLQGESGAGDKIFQGDKEVGWISSAHGGRALAFLRREAWAEGNQVRTAAGNVLTVCLAQSEGDAVSPRT